MGRANLAAPPHQIQHLLFNFPGFGRGSKDGAKEFALIKALEQRFKIRENLPELCNILAGVF